MVKNDNSKLPLSFQCRPLPFSIGNFPLQEKIPSNPVFICPEGSAAFQPDFVQKEKPSAHLMCCLEADESCSLRALPSGIMTSSVHSLSDNSEADEQQKHADSHVQHSSPAGGVSLPGIASPPMHYAAPAQIGVGNAQAAYPYPDPYYRSIFAPYDPQPYAAQPYPAQPMVHLQLMGIQQAGVPLPSEAVEEPVFVNAKQYHGILRRRQSRAKAESENKLSKSRKPYLHESRHLHALRRARGVGGRFQKKNNNLKSESESSERSQDNINPNSEKDDPDNTSSGRYSINAS